MRIEFVPAADARQFIGTALAERLPDLREVRAGVWLRPISDEIDAILCLGALKGATYVLPYGVTCSWIPMRIGNQDPYRWPGSPAKKRMHLWVDQFTRSQGNRSMPTISRSHGDVMMGNDARKAIAKTARRAEKMWRRVSTPEAVLREALWQAGAVGTMHSPGPKFIAAFTYARMGDLDMAQATFEQSIGGLCIEPEVVDRLTDALQQVVAKQQAIQNL